MIVARRLSLTSEDDLRREIHEIGAAPTGNDSVTGLKQLVVRLDGPDEATFTYLSALPPTPSITICLGASGILLAGTAASLTGLISEAESRAPALAQALRSCLSEPGAHVLHCGDRTLRTGSRTEVMGIVNMTGDSFSGDGLRSDTDAAVAQGKRFIEEGATILDIGGESARADVPVAAELEEIERVVPVIERLTAETDVLVSIDTYKESVAAAAVAAGAHIINDIGGFKLDRGTARVAATTGAALVLNYTYERPKVRPASPPQYSQMMAEIIEFLDACIQIAHEEGVSSEQLIVDPGIAFGKSHDEDLEALRRLPELSVLQRPVLIAASRKHFIGAVLGLPPEQRMEGTAAVVSLSIAGGADIVRVHDVKAMARVAAMSDAIVRRRLGDYAATHETWPWPATTTP